MRILIATDGSPASEAAITEIGQRPWPQHSEVRVLTVIEPDPRTYLATAEFNTFVEEAHIKIKDETEKMVAHIVNRLKQTGMEVTGSVREGMAAEEVLDEAKSWDADLILLGTHGRRGLSKFLLGSVAQKVATHAHCSVEIVRAK